MLGIFPEENEPRPTKTVILLESQISFRLRNSPFPHLHLRNKTQSARKWAPRAVGCGALRGYDAFSDCTGGATLWDATRMLQREGATPAAPLLTKEASGRGRSRQWAGGEDDAGPDHPLGPRVFISILLVSCREMEGSGP